MRRAMPGGEAPAGPSLAGEALAVIQRRGLEPISLRDVARAVHRTPAQAIAAGLGMVHQEIVLVTEFRVWENVVLGAEPVDWTGTLRTADARAAVARKIEEYGLAIDPDAPVRSLSVAARQKVEILKLLFREVEILILDEPTAVLAPQEIPQLFAELRRLRDGGKTILFVSHHLDEVLALSDRVSVMRKGRLVDTRPTDSTTREELARTMVGRTVLFTHERRSHRPSRPVFVADRIGYRDQDGIERLRDVSFPVHAGEIVGIAGVEGNGQFQLVNCIMGVSPLTSGAISVDGTDLTDAPILTRRRSISYVSQDRSRLGASVGDSILDNARMTHHRLNARFTRFGRLVLDDTAARRFVEERRERYGVVMAGPDEPFRSLSGGNQQKMILARELSLDTPFVLLDQPTRGLDVGSIEYVHDTILSLTERAVLVISADLDELFRIADRILVLFRGEIVLDAVTDDTDPETVGLAMVRGAS
jgi:simple sugar transport system ATP-binding protein